MNTKHRNTRNQLALFTGTTADAVALPHQPQPKPVEPRSPHLTPVYRIEMVLEREFYGPAVTSPDNLGRLFAAWLGRCPVEHFAICMLNTHLRPMGLLTVSIGTIDMAPVWMPSVFRPAIIQGAPAIAVGHCHPSTSLTPSRADIAITRKIVEAGKLLDIRVVDHIIVGGPSSWSSMAQLGHL